jgi:hypothetical protein
MDNQLKLPIDKHDEFIALLNPIIQFLDDNEFHYLIVTGKDEVCSRYLRGNSDHISGMLTGMMEKHKDFKRIVANSFIGNKPDSQNIF